MNEKRRPIRKRIQNIMLLVSVACLTLASAVGIYSMFSIRGASSEALKTQLEVDLSNSISDKAALANARFGKYSEYITGFSALIHNMYVNPQQYAGINVLPPDAGNQGVLTMQRYLRDNTVTLADVRRELELFGNLETYWNSAIAQNENVITTIYLGTESGLQIAYDASSELGVEAGSYESHFDYSGSDWYRLARESGKTGFTDIYQDSYGRGLMVSCYAPFYDKADNFCGVVCMDMLISDIYQQIVTMDLGEAGQVFLVDSSGMTVDQSTDDGLISIDRFIHSPQVISALNSRENGFFLSSDGDYYVYAPVAATDWTLCISIPEATVMESVYAMNRSILTAIIIVVLVFAILILTVIFTSRSVAKGLTDPLIALGRDAMTISGGDLDYRAEIRNNDEIGDLAATFNEMAASLKQYVSDLTSFTAEKERLSAQYNVARQIQTDMLPNEFPAFPGRREFDVVASMYPSQEIGGDFYDYFLVDDDHLAMVVGDVDGKGVPAALFMVIIKTLIKNRALDGYSPGDVLQGIGEQLLESNQAGMVCRVWMAVLELSTGRGVAINAGNTHPVMRRAGKRFELLEYQHSAPIGTADGVRFRDHGFQMSPGDTLFVYTDGLTDAADEHGRPFGTDGILEALNRGPESSASILVQTVQTSLERFSGSALQTDDITMLALNYYGAGTPEKEWQ